VAGLSRLGFWLARAILINIPQVSHVELGGVQLARRHCKEGTEI